MQDDKPAASAARELKAAARDALRMGSQWAHTALHWIDERSHDMNNRNREQEQREREQRNRYSASGYGSDEGDRPASPQYRSPQPYASRASGQADVLGGRQGRDRDIQAGSDAWRQGQRGREGSYPQAAASPDESLSRGDYARGGYERGDRGQGSRSYASGGYGAGSESYDDQDFSQDYSQGSSHFGSQGFGAQGSQGVFGPQGFGAQGGIGARTGEYGSGYGSSGGYGSGSDQWRARDVGGQGFGGATSYRGLGPKNYTRSDERIREDLNERLTDAHDIDATGISVEVNNGVATLTGSVDQRWMKHRAEDLAEGCSGVRDVNNQIRVQSGQQSTTQRESLYGASGLGGSSQSTQSGAQSTAQSGMGQSTTTQSATSQAASAPSSAGSSTGGKSGSPGSSSTSTNRPGGSSLS